MSLISSIQGFGTNGLLGMPGVGKNQRAEMGPEAFAKDLKGLESFSKAAVLEKAGSAGPAPVFKPQMIDPGAGIKSMISQVDGAMKAGQAQAHAVLAGESDNLHQSMIAMQEGGVAFNMMVEVRNKLVESYQELMRMSV